MYLSDPQGGDQAEAVVALLLGDDDPLAVGNDRLTLEQPDSCWRRRAVDRRGQHELGALLALLHLGEVGLHSRDNLGEQR